MVLSGGEKLFLLFLCLSVSAWLSKLHGWSTASFNSQFGTWERKMARHQTNSDGSNGTCRFEFLCLKLVLLKYTFSKWFNTFSPPYLSSIIRSEWREWGGGTAGGVQADQQLSRGVRGQTSRGQQDFPLSLYTSACLHCGVRSDLANCCQSPWACLRFKPFDLQLFHRKCFQLCLKPKDVRFLAVALFAAWVLLADCKQLSFDWGCHNDYFSWNLTVFCWRSVILIEYEWRGWLSKLLPLAFHANSVSNILQCLVWAANSCIACRSKNWSFVLFVNI